MLSESQRKARIAQLDAEILLAQQVISTNVKELVTLETDDERRVRIEAIFAKVNFTED